MDDTPNDPRGPSDGYATGIVTYVLLLAGGKPDDPHLAKSLTWLRNNQKESGRWFTRSVNADHAHYITNAGSAYALMALKTAQGIKRLRLASGAAVFPRARITGNLSLSPLFKTPIPFGKDLTQPFWREQLLAFPRFRLGRYGHV